MKPVVELTGEYHADINAHIVAFEALCKSHDDLVRFAMMEMPNLAPEGMAYTNTGNMISQALKVRGIDLGPPPPPIDMWNAEGPLVVDNESDGAEPSIRQLIAFYYYTNCPRSPGLNEDHNCHYKYNEMMERMIDRYINEWKLKHE